MKKRLAALLLSFALILSLCPSVLAAKGDEATITVGSVSALRGGTAVINVSIADNPGILGATLTLTYDNDALTLTSADAGDAFSALALTKSKTLASPCNFVWDGQDLSEEDVKDGTILTLTFAVSDACEEGADFPISLSYAPGGVVDADLTPIQPTIVNGTITVIDYVPGDLSGDGTVNTTDVIMLRREVAGGYEQTVNVDAGDVDDNNLWNSTDVILIRRFIAGGYGVVLKPHTKRCAEHTMEAIPAKAATCTEAGNEAYWHCTTCNKYFSDAAGTISTTPEAAAIPAPGHVEEVIPGKDASYTESGLTEGVKCSRCQAVLVEQQVIPMMQKDAYTIQYMCDMVPSTDTRYYLQNDITDHFHYTVGVEKALPQPQLDKYTFVGWSDADGNLVGGDGKVLPKGTTGDVVLYANWVSNRNRAKPVKNLGDPIRYEDAENGVLLFQYKIGTIENIPLYTTLTLQCADGLITTVSQTNQTKIGKTDAKSVAEKIATETTKSASWTLSEEWNESTKVSQSTIDDLHIDKNEAETLATSNTSEYNVGKSYSQRTGTTDSNGSSVAMTNNSGTSWSHTDESGQNFGLSVDASLKTTGSADVMFAKASTEFSVGIGVDYSNYGKNTDTTAGNRSFSRVESSEESHTVTAEKTWNSQESYGISDSVSHEESYSKGISLGTSLEKGQSMESAAGGGKSSSEDYGEKDAKSSEFGSVVTFDTEEIETHYTSFSSNGNTHGNYRMVMAGSADVYAIVGYDIAKATYFVYTYTVTNKATEEYLDYSWDGTFTDYESSILPFKIPFEVNEFVNARITQSQGLLINPTTGIVEGYEPEEGWKDPLIYVPSYHRVMINGEYKSVKVTGIAPGLFENNPNVEAVVLSSFITEIPDNAFKNCSSLKAIYCPGVTKIGDHAFDGCTSLDSFTVPYEITSVGEKAFVGVQKVIGYVSTKEMAYTLADSGAQNIVLNISKVGDSDLFFNVGEVESFELHGNGKTFNNLAIESAAQSTLLDGMTIVGGNRTPIVADSQTLTLDNVTVTAKGIALILKNAATGVKVNNECNLSSNVGKAIVCDEMTVSRLTAGVYGKLNLSGDLLACGSVNGSSNISFISGEIKELPREEYENYRRGVLTVTFDANGGSVSESSREVYAATPIGTLPVPTKANYGFTGWYLDDGETKVTEETTFASETTLYAHWEIAPYTASWATAAHCTISVSRTSSPEANAAVGPIENGAAVYYGDVLSVTYTPETGYSIATNGATSVTVEGNVTSSTIYATAAVKSFKATWNAPAHCTISVSRTSSPKAGAAAGALSSNATVYYGDVLSVTYTAETGYSIATNGAKSVTVSDNVTSSTIYATVSVNSYTVSWNTVAHCTISVSRTSSPKAGAATGALSNNAKIYYGDVLSVTYTPENGYHIATKGSSPITVSGNVTSSAIYATTGPNSYNISVVCKSASPNGPLLRSYGDSYTVGTAKTITPPEIPGYKTPDPQTIPAGSTGDKTITFYYTPVDVASTNKVAQFCSDPVMTYSATVEHQNRTANSVQIRVIWETTIAKNGYNIYGQNFRAWAGGSQTNDVQVAAAGTWKNSSSYARAATGVSNWITVPVGTTNATSISLGIYYWETNYNGTDMTANYGAAGVSGTWSIAIPAY